MSEPVVSNRRRRDNKDPKETPGGAAAAGDAPEMTRERKVSSDIPAEMVGTTATGIISALSKSSMKSKFGFIQTANKLIIYFNFDSYTDEEFAKPKKGVEVSFLCGKDEKGRSGATEVRLTAAGREQAKRFVNGRSIRTAQSARPDAHPMPAELDGKKTTGVISRKGGRHRFGFIDLNGFGEVAPHIYFRYADSEFAAASPKDLYYPRAGLEVEFTCHMDAETNRAFATDVVFTAAGRAAAETRAVERTERAKNGNEEKGSGAKSAKERKPTMEVVPGLAGTSMTGIIEFAETKSSREKKFGFIDVAASRIYFSFADFQDAKHQPRKGLEVSFEVSVDDTDRPFASKVRLTASGAAEADRKAAAAST